MIDIPTFAAEGPCSAIGIGLGVCRPSELASMGEVFPIPLNEVYLVFWWQAGRLNC